jgi:NhaP-type Na+/H+ or K+/H+ antiporter
MLERLLLPALPTRQGGQNLFRIVAEIGLVLLLFSDASRTGLRVLKNIRNLP